MSDLSSFWKKEGIPELMNSFVEIFGKQLKELGTKMDSLSNEIRDMKGQLKRYSYNSIFQQNGFRGH